MKYVFFLLFAVLCAASCGRRRAPSVSVPAAAEVPPPAVFLPALPPSHLSAPERADYMRAHYWDRFDFADTLFLARADTMQMLNAFALYAAQYLDPADPAPVDSLMRKAAVSRPMLEYFGMLAERVFYDPNSPLRSDELYIPVLRALAASEWFDAWERARPAYRLQLALQNRVGQPANDFRFTLPSGVHGTLYGVQADYTLLFITNPECPMCRELREEIMASPRLNEMTERGELQVVALYPDEDLTAWRKHLPEMPGAWINAFDEGCTIRERSLYDLKAIPSLYLLDRRKRVLLKDSASVPDVEAVLDRQS